MKSQVKRVVPILFLAGLLLTPMALRRLQSTGSAESQGAASATAKGALSSYGFRLDEVSKQSGIDFMHQAPKLDAKLDHIMPQVASMGAGVAVADFDRDGWNDFYITNSGEKSKNHLYRNKRDGTFEEVAKQMGVASLNDKDGVSMGAVWGDYDNDGFEDLFVYKWGQPELYRNERGKKFTRVTEKTGFPAWINANTAIWLDYDRDSKLDLFIGGYYREDVNLWKLKDTRMMPDSFEYAQNGGRKYLLRNVGNGRFEDVTEQTGLKSTRWALAAAAADLRGTGYPDIFIANDYGVSELFANQGGERYKEIGKPSGVGYAPKSGMNASVGDVLNKGQFAVYVSNITDEGGNLLQYNNLWVPRDGTSGDKVHYDNMATAMGVGNGGWSFGAQFGDLNNDGTLDLYLVNGYISADKNRSYWYDYSKIATGNSAIIHDASHWPPMKGRSLSGYQAKRVWMNDGAGKFSDVAQAAGVNDRHDGRAVAMADLWNRGVLDVLVSNQRGPVLIYKNTSDPQNKWIGFDLKGTKGNRSAIGAQVKLFWNGMQQVQEVSGGSGFCAQNMRRLHFGLGKDPKIEKAVIRWPSGKEQTLTDVKIGQINSLKEPA